MRRCFLLVFFFQAEDGIRAATVTRVQTCALPIFPTDGVFVFVGLSPNTQFLKESSVELDEIGFIKTNGELETSMKGVFAAGDVRSGATMQVRSEERRVGNEGGVRGKGRRGRGDGR